MWLDPADRGDSVDSKASWSLANLKTPCVDPKYVTDLNGIEWPGDPQFQTDFSGFFRERPKTCDDGKSHRYGFELFLQSQKLLTRNYAAARLGMKPESLDQLLPELPKLGLPKKYEVYKGIIEGSLSDDLVTTLPRLRFRTFGTHDSFCEFLHKVFKETLGLSIEPLFCATSLRLGDPRLYAYTWDNILIEPMSVKHSVWLDLGKPLSLAPDRCSKLFFAENCDEMRPYLAGREEPHDLSFYADFSRRSA
jgi:hypothetical protein